MSAFAYIDEKYIRQLSMHTDRFKEVGNGTYNCRCLYCGDSAKSAFKARGYFYTNDKGNWRYKCHNCAINVNISTFLKFVSPSMYEEYRFEVIQNYNEEKKLTKKKEDKVEIVYKQHSAEDFITTKKVLKSIHKLNELDKENIGVKYILDRQIPENKMTQLYYTDSLKSVVKHISSYDIERVPDIKGIIIPYFSEDGILESFQIRNIDPQSDMRYLTYDIVKSPSHIYNYQNIKKDKPVYVFEGAFDSMFCINAVAASGASILQKLDKIKEINKNVVIVFDNDYKTNEVIMKLLSDIIEKGYSVVLFNNEMNGYKDINAYVKDKLKSVSEVTEYLRQCTYSDLGAKMFLASQKRDRGSLRWANESTSSTQKQKHKKTNKNLERKNTQFMI